MNADKNTRSARSDTTTGVVGSVGKTEHGGAAQFTTTHWSVVLSAGRQESDTAYASLEKLCRNYWYPLYVFVRRKGYPPHEAQDLTQGFFARLLEKNYLAGLDRTKGKFRSFLLAAFEHYVANEWRR